MRMVRLTSAAAIALALGGAARAQVVIQHPKVVPVRWTAAAPDFSAFLFRLAATNGWMLPEWGVGQGISYRDVNGHGWIITPAVTTGSSITDAGVVAELSYQLNHGGLPFNLSECDSSGCNVNYIYMVQMPSSVDEQSAQFDGTPGLELCGTVSTDTVSDNHLGDANAECGYHRGFITTINGVTAHVRYAVVPDFTSAKCKTHWYAAPPVDNASIKCDKTATVASHSCTIDSDTTKKTCTWTFNAGNTTDNATILMSHELSETYTNPDGLNPAIYEMADTCEDRGTAGDPIVTAPLIGHLPAGGGAIQQLGRHDASCFVQCSDTPQLCAAQEHPEEIMSLAGGVLQ